MNLRHIVFNRISLLILVLLLAAGGYALWARYGATPEQQYRTAEVRSGNITQSVSANGALKPVVLVNVGTQVSGTVRKLYVDFNDQVKQGQVLAELDPSVLNAQVQQTEASMANVRAQVDLAAANEARAATLFKQEYISRQEYDQAVQALRSARAQLAQVNAQLTRDKTNLGYAIIRSPVSGVVVARSVDVGQTVAASLQTPTLFQIAQDLRQMQVDTAFAEADIGAIKPGQPVQFTVDAFPNRTFNATVKQIRLNATTTQNVVTYNVVVSVDNPDAILLPGMTAYVSVIIAQRSDALLVPNSALRFRPASAGDTPSAGGARERPAQKQVAPAAEAGGEDGEAAPKQARPQVSEEGGGTGGAPDDKAARRRRFSKGEGAGPSGPGGAANGAGGGEQRGVVYVLEGKQLRRVPIRLGISDGRSTEILGGGLKPGDQVVTGAIDNSAPATGSAQGQFRMRLF